MASPETSTTSSNAFWTLENARDELSLVGIFSVPTLLLWIMLNDNPKTKKFALIPPAILASFLVFAGTK